MPVRSSSSRPAARPQRASSEGRMNFKYSCVPRGKTRVMYSAPTMATANAMGLRFKRRDDDIAAGLHQCAKRRETLAAGSGTCSSISMQVTRSNAAGRSRRQLLRGDALDTRPRLLPRGRAVRPRRAPPATDRCRAPAHRRAPSPRRGCPRRSRHRAPASRTGDTARSMYSQAQRIEVVQRLGRALRIPPALRECAEFGEFRRIGIASAAEVIGC